MAIDTEFIDFIVPIATIHAKYPGGWEQCLKDHAPLMGGNGFGARVWYDEHLLRDGAMSPQGITSLVEEWEAMGFVAHEEVNGVRQFKDFCVHEGLFGGPTLLCPWLSSDGSGAVWLTGTEPGPRVGRPPR